MNLKNGKPFKGKFVGPDPLLIKRNLLGRDLTKVEKHLYKLQPTTDQRKWLERRLVTPQNHD
jgi:hypothetical protein